MIPESAVRIHLFFLPALQRRANQGEQLIIGIVGKEFTDNSCRSLGVGKGYKLFDNSRVVSAYKSCDDSGLSDFERDIYDEAKKILDEIKVTATSDYEIELAVHDYIVGSSTYDRDAISALEKPKKNSENPYGILINKTGICLGYTTTFQLFMDMAEIPCKTIYAEDDDGDEHAWNQVEIDGKWYYVDCTWDDPVPEEKDRPPFHEFFNVTEDYMWKSGHRWDRDKCEESNSFKNSYLYKEAVEIYSWDDIRDVMKQAVDNGKGDVSVVADKSFDGYDEVMTGGGKIFELETVINYKSQKYLLYVAY